MIVTGVFSAGITGKVKTGVLRYCITCHLRDGKVDRVHEFITSTSWWLNSLMPMVLWNVRRLATKRLAAESARARASQ